MLNEITQKHPLLVPFVGHYSPVCAVAFAPGGKLLASASYDGSVIIWDISTGKIIRKLPVVSNTELELAFSLDGHILMTSGYEQNRLWDVVTGKLICDLPKRYRFFVFTSNGEGLIGTNWNGRLLKFTLDSDKPVKHYPKGAYIRAASSDRKTILIADDSDISVVDAVTGKVTQKLRLPFDFSAHSIAYSNSGNIFALISYDDGFVVCDLDSGSVLLREDVGDNMSETMCTALSPDGNLFAVGSKNGSVSLWETENWELAAKIQISEEWARMLAFSSDGKMLAVGDDSGTVTVWDAKSSALQHRFDGYSCSVSDVSIAYDGLGIGVTYKDGVKGVWSNGFARRTLQFESKDIKIAIELDEDQNIVVVDIPSGDRWLCGEKLWHSAQKPEDYLSPDGSLVAIYVNESIEIWDTVNRRLLHALKLDELCALKFSPDNSVLAVSDWGFNVFLWDVKTGQLLHKLRLGGDFGSSLAFSPNSRRLAVGTDFGNEVEVFSVRTGRRLLRLRGHVGDITAVAFSQNGRLLITGAQDGTVRLWNSKNGQLLATLLRIPHEENDDWLVYTPDGRFDCSSDAESIIRWEINGEYYPFAAFADQYRYPSLLEELINFGCFR